MKLKAWYHADISVDFEVDDKYQEMLDNEDDHGLLFDSIPEIEKELFRQIENGTAKIEAEKVEEVIDHNSPDGVFAVEANTWLYEN